MSATAFASPEELTGRIFSSMIGAFDLYAVYLGDQLGFYRSLARDGAATSTELAARTGAAERYTREWLEQQAVTGMLAVDDPSLAPDKRRYRLPDGYAEVLTDPSSLLTATPMAQIFVGTVLPIQEVLEAYRTGKGVPFANFGPDLAQGQAGGTLPLFTHLLGQEWLPSIPRVHKRLSSDPPARVADIGMGLGWSSIAIAKAYPNVRVDGFDLDEYSVKAARANAESEGVADRVKFEARDAGDPALAGNYDFALAFECVHDMSNPVAVLSSMRRLVGKDGLVLIVDEKAEDAFAPHGLEVERLFYGFSILHCLPVGMVDQPSAETGAVMRADTLKRYAADAGFRNVEILPIENDIFRFYLLTQ